MRKTYKYRIYPNKTEEKILNNWLKLCCNLYNTMIEQRKIVYEEHKRSMSVFDQINEITGLKKEIPEYAEIPTSVLQNVAKRVDKAYQRFFKIKGTGYPKFKKSSRYDSITFTSGCVIKNNKIRVLRCGEIKVKWSREIRGTVKETTIKRTRSGKWFVCFSCDKVPSKIYPQTDKKIGIDLGIECLVTTSDGERLGETKFLKKSLKRIKQTQKHLSRQKRGSKRRKKTVKRLARLHEKVANQRLDMQQKITTKLVTENAEIHCEDINPSFLTKNKKFTKNIYDVAWGLFLTLLAYKVATANRSIKKKNPEYTSQECYKCGRIKQKSLSERMHICDCGASLHRDHNSAIVILNRLS